MTTFASRTNTHTRFDTLREDLLSSMACEVGPFILSNAGRIPANATWLAADVTDTQSNTTTRANVLIMPSPYENLSGHKVDLTVEINQVISTYLDVSYTTSHEIRMSLND